MLRRGQTIGLTLLVLTALLGPRLVWLDQPIVENYVGRQIPTAMVARNLDRDGEFLRPKLDTGPFPNYFLVEPPVYAAAVVGLHRLGGLPLEASGRVVSASGTLLTAWGLFVLCRRRQGDAIAWLSVFASALFPVTLRYGRAFQPDALAFGLVVAGVAALDRALARGARFSGLALGLLAAGLAAKGIFACLLVPLLVEREPGEAVAARLRRWWWLPLAFVPALLWYAQAAVLLRSGSRASLDNAGLWARAFWPEALLRAETWGRFGRYLFARCYGPPGSGLAAWGILGVGVGRFWMSWLGSAGLMLLLLAAKSHHEYYWLVLAPAVAVAVATAIDALARACPWPGTVRSALVLMLGASSLIQVADTYRTPAPWAALGALTAAIREHLGPDEPLIAPEAVLFAADRRGYRLETEPAAVRRARGEWGPPARDWGGTPAELIAWYHAQGARHLADLADPALGPLAAPWHETLRRDPGVSVLVDRPGLLLVRWRDPPHAPR